jgi:glutamate-ammonia-ligase adenylyltransferase
VNVTPEKAEAIIRELPDPGAAANFLESFDKLHPRAAKKLRADAGLFSDAISLAAWSPLLATTLLQNPEYIAWLARVRKLDVTRSGIELLESLGRFGGTHSQLPQHDLLSRFRRRELLRIYLQDIRRTGTVSEITEELSRLADAILTHALRLAQQEMENRYGIPQLTDAQGRTIAAEFAVVALGKLGSLELNFASDIDLMFIFSAEGSTSGRGTRGQIGNREFFDRLARAVVQMVGAQSGEGAAYRVDLRLRPYGRDGALVSSLDEAVRYYSEKAQAWELQALIRSRSAAGSPDLYAHFAARVAPSVYSPTHTWAAVSESNVDAKRKIDEKVDQQGVEFNVKLGRGGIREIEFIAQALGMAGGGNDPWLRSPHTLIALGRLEERHLISNQERIDLFQAYEFLRTLEHRLQMEEGLQTHSVPATDDRRALVARRMNFREPHALRDFDRTLKRHTEKVKRIFDRVMRLQPINGSATKDSPVFEGKVPDAPTLLPAEFVARESDEAVTVLAQRLTALADTEQEAIDLLVRDAAGRAVNPSFASMITRIAESLKRSEVQLKLSADEFASFLELCAASEPFAEMFSANPALIGAVTGPAESSDSFAASFQREVLGRPELREEFSAMRRVWANHLIAIASAETAKTIDMRESNRRQTALAEASIDCAWQVAIGEMRSRFGAPANEFRFTVLGLGRLGGRGMDYGSDLDVILVYDDQSPSPYPESTHAEVYARATEIFVNALSSLTRDGYLYRVDLRLRPDGRFGPICSGAGAFLDYLRSRAQPWEWLAYVKLRAVGAGGDDWGTRVEMVARSIVHERAEAHDGDALREETRRVRDRLEQERAGRPGGLDIKYGAGGMLDVYFAVRFLQLRHGIPDQPDDRTTIQTLRKLNTAEVLGQDDFAAFLEGYRLLRDLDHRLRLAVGRVRRVPGAGHAAVEAIAREMGYANAAALLIEIEASMWSIRRVYSNIVG